MGRGAILVSDAMEDADNGGDGGGSACVGDGVGGDDVGSTCVGDGAGGDDGGSTCVGDGARGDRGGLACVGVVGVSKKTVVFG